MDSKERFTREEVMAIPNPEFTKTWHPIPHRDVILSLEQTLKSKGVGVRQETYSVMNSGRNMFGTWVLDIEKKGTALQVGFRNSMSKKFAVGICAGTWVIACSNMMFRGDFIEFRKHTSGISFEELLEVEERAYVQVLEQGNKLIEWQENLRRHVLNPPEFKQITYDAMDAGVLAPNHFKLFQSSYAEELELSKIKNGTLYEFHGAVTRMNRELNLFTVDGRTRALGDICDKYMQSTN